MRPPVLCQVQGVQEQLAGLQGGAEASHVRLGGAPCQGGAEVSPPFNTPQPTPSLPHRN